MNAATVIAPPVTNSASTVPQNTSIWRRMFDAWVRSYEARISPDGKVFYGGL